MKRIELSIEPSVLDRFTDAARDLNLSDFDVSEVRRSTSAMKSKSQRLYRGCEFVLDLVARLKIEVNVADEAATRIAHNNSPSMQNEGSQFSICQP